MSTGRCPILRTRSSSPQTMPVAIPDCQGLSPPCFHATMATPLSRTPLAMLGSRPHASWLCLVPPPSSTSHAIRLSPEHHPRHVCVPSIDSAVAASGPHAFWQPASLVIRAPTLHPQPCAWHVPNPRNSGHTISGGVICPCCAGPSCHHVTIMPTPASPCPRHRPSPTPLSDLATTPADALKARQSPIPQLPSHAKSTPMSHKHAPHAPATTSSRMPQL